MEGRDLISVIVPVYNVENYLHECLRSILSQTYQNLEIILINDGSTDASGQICEDYAAKDGRIRVIHQENGGLSLARNVGIVAAQGTYLTFVDSDDGIHEPFIQSLYDAVMEYQADIAISNYYKYDERDGKFYFHNLNQDDLVEVLTPQECLDYQCDLKSYTGVSMVTAWGKLYHTRLFKDIRFPTGKLMEDEMTTHGLFLKANRAVFVNKNYYLYRIRHTSITQKDDLLVQRIAHKIEAFEKKFTDWSLSESDTTLLKNRFYYHLLEFKSVLEKNSLSQSDSYHKICHYLSYYEDN